jgi:phage terminase large subunit
VRDVFLPYNPVYSDYNESDKRYAVLWGGAGSGKSHATAQKHVVRALRNPGERFLIARQVARTCRASTFRLLLDVVRDLGVGCHVNASEMTIAFPNGSNILHAGLDDVEKLKSIAGITSVWIEEASEIKENDFHQVDLRLRGAVPTYRQVTTTFNPTSKRLWIKPWMEGLDADHRYELHTTWRDNQWVDEEYARVLAGLPEDMRAIYERGEWGEAIKGLIYPAWTTANSLGGAPDAYGLDFGFNHPNALIAIRLADPDLVVEELLYETHLKTPDLIERMKALNIRRDVPLFCDSARPDIIAEIQAAGFYALKANKEVDAGIQTVRKYNLQVVKGSQNLVNELHSYKWAELRDGTPTDKPIKFLDDALDALRYATHTLTTNASWGLW